MIGRRYFSKGPAWFSPMFLRVCPNFYPSCAVKGVNNLRIGQLLGGQTDWPDGQQPRCHASERPVKLNTTARKIEQYPKSCSAYMELCGTLHRTPVMTALKLSSGPCLFRGRAIGALTTLKFAFIEPFTQVWWVLGFSLQFSLMNGPGLVLIDICSR